MFKEMCNSISLFSFISAPGIIPKANLKRKCFFLFFSNCNCNNKIGIKVHNYLKYGGDGFTKGFEIQ